MTMRTKLHRETLSHQIAESLVRYVEELGLGPGEVLPSEVKLAADFGVSRPVIREALKSLAAQGMLVISNGKGAMVKPLDGDPLLVFFQRAVRMRRESMVELLELRRGVELQNASLAALRRTEEQAATLGLLVAQMRESLDDLEQWTEHDTKLHLCIAQATHNALIYYLTESIREPIMNLMREGFRHRRDAEQRERNQRVHEELVAAIQAGDAPAAVEAMEHHFDEVTALMHNDVTPKP